MLETENGDGSLNMLIWVAWLALARAVWAATEPHRGAEMHSEPTHCMKSWSTAICTISTISIIGGLILLMFIIVGGWRIRSWLRDRKLRKTLQDPDFKSYHGDAPATPRYANGPAAFKAPSRPSSVISVLKRSGKGQAKPYEGSSPCSTRPLIVTAAPSPVAQAPPHPAQPPVAYHLPRRAMMQIEASMPHAGANAAQQSAYEPPPRPNFIGSSSFQNAWQATNPPAHQKYTIDEQHFARPPQVMRHHEVAVQSAAPSAPLSAYIEPVKPGRPTLSHYSSAPTHTSISSSSSYSYTVSTPSPTPTFSIPVSPAVQRVRAKSMIQPSPGPQTSKRMTYHAATGLDNHDGPPPLPPIQTSNLDSHGPSRPRKSLKRKSAPQAQRVKSSSAVIPSPDDAARIGPSWHRNKMRLLQ